MRDSSRKNTADRDVQARAYHDDQEGLHHVRAGCVRACRRFDRPCAGDHLRSLGRDDRVVAWYCRAGYLPRSRPARLEIADAGPAYRASAPCALYGNSDLGGALQVGQEHYDTATAVQKILQDYKSLQAGLVEPVLSYL
jgi:hypothetical protein